MGFSSLRLSFHYLLLDCHQYRFVVSLLFTVAIYLDIYTGAQLHVVLLWIEFRIYSLISTKFIHKLCLQCCPPSLRLEANAIRYCVKWYIHLRRNHIISHHLWRKCASERIKNCYSSLEITAIAYTVHTHTDCNKLRQKSTPPKICQFTFRMFQISHHTRASE